MTAVSPASRWLPAVMSASQLEPSCISPSPRTTKVRRGEPSSFAAMAIPTAMGSPWPSGPVLASTAAILVLAGCPLSIDSGFMKVARSAVGMNPATASVV